jgi:hypothetical protein
MPLRSPKPADDPGDTTCTLWFIRRELGQHGYSDRRMIAYVRQLIAHHDFPHPLPAMTKGGALSADVTARSTWVRAGVEAWIEGFLPPDGAALVDRKARADAAASMDDAARHLRLVGGRDMRGVA